MVAACTRPTSAKDELARVLPGWRPAEARLVGFGHAPCRTTHDDNDLIPDATCAPEFPLEGAEVAQLEKIGAHIRRQLERVPDAASHHAQGLHARGLWHLLFSYRDDTRLTRAVEDLQTASELDPRDPAILSDLAALHLLRASRADEHELLTRALTYADRALTLAPALPEACHNRALALSMLHLRKQALASWRACAEGDLTSPWRDEIRARIEALSRPTAGDAWADNRRWLLEQGSTDPRRVSELALAYPQFTRQLVEDELLGRWARAELEGRHAEAEATMNVIRTIAETLARRGPGTLLSEIVARLDTTPVELRRYASYAEARALHERQSYRDSSELFARLADELEQRNNPLHLLARFHVAVADYHAQRYARAYADLGRLAVVAEDRGYVALGGYCDWMRGLIQGRRANHDLAQRHFHNAYAAFQSLGENENVGAIHSLLAAHHSIMGHDALAWKHVYHALSQLPKAHKSRRKQNVYAVAVGELRKTRQLAAAADFQQALAEEALTSENVLSATLAFQLLAELLFEMGRESAARDALARSRASALELPDDGLRDSLRLRSAMLQARIQRAAAPESALARLQAMLGEEAVHSEKFLLPDALLELARAQKVLGHSEEALQALDLGLAELGRQSTELDKIEERIQAQDRARDLAEEAVRICLEVPGAEQRALAYSDAFRALDLRDASSTPPAPGPDPRQVTRPPPAGTAWLEYMVLKDRLLIWARTPRETLLRSVARSASDLEARVDEWLARIASRDGSEAGHASELFDRLIRPIHGALAGVDRLVIVPDLFLHELPFAALRDDSTGRYLVEDFTLTVTPSLAIHAQLTARKQRLDRAPPRTLLALADPRIDADVFPGLASLPQALPEAEAIAALYPAATLLSGERATAAETLRSLREADVFHFTGHALLDRRAGRPASLLVTPEPDDPDTTVLDVSRFEGPWRARLVVLAACDSAAGPISLSSGALSAARPFLRAGAPDVVAALWKVDDEATGALMVAFHRAYLQDPRDAPSALRKAQLESFNDPAKLTSKPFHWAAFQILGAG